LSILALSARQSRKMSSELTRMCASNSITFWRSSRSNPVITEITRMSTVTPSVTPRIEINVMIDRNVRFGFKYRNARKRLNGRFNSALAWRQIHFNSTMHAYTEVWVAHSSRDRELFLRVLLSSLRAKLKGKFVSARYRNQHAGRVRYPELPGQRGRSQLISARELLALPA
jgi:hypothetical protein